MAINVDISKITGINQVGNSYQRKSAVPLDYYSLFNTKAEAEAYAASNPVSYVGQVISYIDNNEVKVCFIADAAGTLKEVGTAPVGSGAINVTEEGVVSVIVDEKSIEISDGKIAMHDFGTAYYEYVPEVKDKDGKVIGPATYKRVEVSEAKPWKAGLEPRVALEDNQLVVGWYEPNPTTIEGINNQVTALQGEVADLVTAIANALAEAKKYADDNDANTVTTVESGDKYVSVQATVDSDAQKNYKISLVESELKALIGAETTAAMEFKGVVSALPETGNKGDMYKVSGAFNVPADKDAQGNGFDAKIGDSIVLDSNGKWYHIPTGDDIEDTWRPVTDVDTDASLTFAAGEKLDVNVANNGTVTYSHETVAAPTGSEGTGRTYLTGVTTDGYGHITGYTTASESDQDLSGYKTKQEAYSAEGSTVKTVTKVEQDANGEVTVTYSDIAFPTPPALSDATGTQDKVHLTHGSEDVEVNAYSTNKVDVLLGEKADKSEIPTKVSELSNDKGYISDVKMRGQEVEGDVVGYTPVLNITKATVDGKIVVTVDDEEIQSAITGVKNVADTAVQSVEFAGVALSKDNSNKASISKEAAQNALGLKALAYQDSIDTGVHAVSLQGGTNNGTLKLTVDGTSTDNIAVTGLGSAAYTNSEAYEAAGEVGKLKGNSTDSTEAVTVYGVQNLAKSILGTSNDGATANTVYGAHAAVKALADGAVKTNADSIKKLSDDIGNLSNIMNFRGVVPKKSDSISTDAADAGIGELKDGDVVIWGDKEFVYSGGAWHEFGDATGNADAISQLTDRVNIIESWKPGLASNTNAGLIKGTAHTVANGVTTGKGVHIESGEVKSVSMDLLINGDFEIIFCAGDSKQNV